MTTGITDNAVRGGPMSQPSRAAEMRNGALRQQAHLSKTHGRGETPEPWTSSPTVPARGRCQGREVLGLRGRKIRWRSEIRFFAPPPTDTSGGKESLGTGGVWIS